MRDIVPPRWIAVRIQWDTCKYLARESTYWLSPLLTREGLFKEDLKEGVGWVDKAPKERGGKRGVDKRRRGISVVTMADYLVWLGNHYQEISPPGNWKPPALHMAQWRLALSVSMVGRQCRVTRRDLHGLNHLLSKCINYRSNNLAGMDWQGPHYPWKKL